MRHVAAHRGTALEINQVGNKRKTDNFNLRLDLSVYEDPLPSL